MNEVIELPPGVIAAIKAGRKVEAIKLLRAHSNIDLAEAKHLVERYQLEHGDDMEPGKATSGTFLNFLIIVSAIAVAVYLLFRFM